jgi:hypothetical protein
MSRIKAGDEVLDKRYKNAHLLLGGRVSVVFHAQGVDLVADAPFDARLRFAQRLLRAG